MAGEIEVTASVSDIVEVRAWPTRADTREILLLLDMNGERWTWRLDDLELGRALAAGPGFVTRRVRRRLAKQLTRGRRGWPEDPENDDLEPKGERLDG